MTAHADTERVILQAEGAYDVQLQTRLKVDCGDGLGSEYLSEDAFVGRSHGIGDVPSCPLHATQCICMIACGWAESKQGTGKQGKIGGATVRTLGEAALPYRHLEVSHRQAWRN